MTLTYQMEQPIRVDWDKLRTHLELDATESLNPEEIIHELLHGYECLGVKALTTKLGDQMSVAKMIKKHITTEIGQDSSEIRVSAATILVLQKIGHLDVLDIMKSCADNLRMKYGEAPNGTLFEKRREIHREVVFHRILAEMQKPKVQQEAKATYRFITTKFKL